LWGRVGADVDLILISAPWHIHYLANYFISPTTLNAASTGLLALTREGTAHLFVDNWTEAVAKSAHVDQVVVHTWYDMVGPGDDRHAGVVAEALTWLRARHPRHVAVEVAHLPWAIGATLAELGATLADVTPALLALRLQKDPDELACLRFVVQAAVAGHAAARQAVQPGASEFAVYAAVHAATVEAAGGPITMLGDFASSGRPADGGPPAAQVLLSGDLMIVDFFPVVDGYRSDITNTYVAGQPTDLQRHYMDFLLQAKAAGEAMLRPGVTGGQVHAAVRGAFASAGVAHFFPHHAGHALGLMHPESPFFVPESQEPLQENQVVTLEPGLYNPAVGSMRIEDNYVITANGCERWSDHHKGF
jgi:Xaa-Pro aminopeptidase